MAAAHGVAAAHTNRGNSEYDGLVPSPDDTYRTEWGLAQGRAECLECAALGKVAHKSVPKARLVAKRGILARISMNIGLADMAR